MLCKPNVILWYSVFFFWHIIAIAILHFNKDLGERTRKSQRNASDGSKQVSVVYPKFKNGEATVRDVKGRANFGKYF